MLSTFSSHSQPERSRASRPEGSGLPKAIEDISDCVGALRATSGRAEPESGEGRPNPLRRISEILSQLPRKEQAQAAHFACELLLESDSISPRIVRAINDIDRNFSVSSVRPESLMIPATKCLQAGLATFSPEDLAILRRFAAPDLSAAPGMTDAFKHRIATDVSRGEAPQALQIYYGFPELQAAVRSDPEFITTCISLLPLLLEPWAPERLTKEAPKLAVQLFPLTREGSLAYMGALHRAFTRAIDSGCWSKARAVVACPVPQPGIDGVSASDVGQFLQRMRADAVRPVDTLVSSAAAYGEVSRHLGKSDSAADLLRDVFSASWPDQLGIAHKIEAAARDLLCEGVRGPYELHRQLDIVARQTALYALFTPEERAVGKVPLYRRTQVVVAHKLHELAVHLWYLSAFGRELFSPELRGADSEDFGRFKLVFDEAQRTFNLDPARYVASSAILSFWKTRYELRRAAEPQLTLDTEARGFLQRTLLKLGLQLQMVQCKLDARQALRSSRTVDAFCRSAFLLELCALKPGVRGTLSRDVVATAGELLRQSCPSEPQVRGMLTSVLVRELRRGPTDLRLVAGLAQQSGEMFEAAGKLRVAEKLFALERCCAQKPPSPRALAELMATLNPKSLSTL